MNASFHTALATPALRNKEWYLTARQPRSGDMRKPVTAVTGKVLEGQA